MIGTKTVHGYSILNSLHEVKMIDRGGGGDCRKKILLLLYHSLVTAFLHYHVHMSSLEEHVYDMMTIHNKHLIKKEAILLIHILSKD